MMKGEDRAVSVRNKTLAGTGIISR
jgi:hypothetical protein